MTRQPLGLHAPIHSVFPRGQDPLLGLMGVGYLWGVNGTPVSIASGATGTRVPWGHFQTTNAELFGTDTAANVSPGPYHNAAGDTYLYFNAPGAYLAVGGAQWESGAFEQAMVIDNVGAQYVLDVGGSAVSSPEPVGEEIATNVASILGIFSLFAHRMFYVDSTATPGILAMNVAQTSGSPKNLVNATLGIFYLGDNGDLVELY